MMAARRGSPARPIEALCPVQRIRTGLSVLLTLPFVGCERVWDLANRRAATADVRALVAAASIPTETLDCHMVGTTRAVECQLGADPDAVARLVATLALTPVEPGSAVGAAASARDEAPADLAGGARPVPTFGVAGRPATLRLPNGTAFDHLFLFLDTGASTIWLRLTYAYG